MTIHDSKCVLTLRIDPIPLVNVLLGELRDVLAIYTFGSQVDGTATDASDMDIAVLVAGYADPIQLWNLSGILADLALCPVDLLDLRAASTVMQYQVIQSGIRLWGQEPQAGLFECFVLNEKIALDLARAPLLNQIQATGQVYA
jgi:uncharacterized protein